MSNAAQLAAQINATNDPAELQRLAPLYQQAKAAEATPVQSAPAAAPANDQPAAEPSARPAFGPRDDFEQPLFKHLAAATAKGDQKGVADVTREIAKYRTAQKVAADYHANNAPNDTQAAALGVGDATGLQDYATALFEGDWINPFDKNARDKNGLNYQDRLDVAKMSRQMIAGDHPVSTLAGEVAGFSGASALAGAGARAVGAGGGGALTQLATKAAVVGGAKGALDAAAAPGDAGTKAVAAGEGAATGAAENAILAPLGAKAAELAAMPAKAVLSRLASDNALRALVEKAGIPIKDLVAQTRAGISQFAGRVGYQPTLGEVLPKQAAVEAGQIIRQHPGAVNVAQALEPATDAARQAGVANAIVPGSGSAAPGAVPTQQLTAALDRPFAQPITSRSAATNAMPARDVQLTSGDARAIVQNPDVMNMTRGLRDVSPVKGGVEYESDLRDAVDQAMRDAETGRPVRLTVAQADALRQKAAALGLNRAVGAIYDAVDQSTGGQYSRLLQGYKATANLDEVSTAAKSSPTGVPSQGSNPALNPNVAAELRTKAGTGATARVQGVLTTAAKAQANVAEIVPGQTAATADPAMKAAKAVTDVGLAAKGYRGAIVSLMNTLGQLRIGNKSAEKLANQLLNPTLRDATIAKLERLGARKEVIDGILQTVGAATANSLRPQGAPEGSGEGTTPDTADLTSLPTSKAADALPGVADEAKPGIMSKASPEVQDAITKAAAATGVSVDLLAKTAKRESGFRADVPSKSSSATGLFQFTDGTWLKTIHDLGSTIGLDRAVSYIDAKGQVPDALARKQLLALRNDPEIASLVAAAFTKQNSAEFAKSLGRDPTDGELYAAHFLGVAGAKRLISNSQGSSVAAAALFPQAARANRSMFYGAGGKALSAKELLSKLTADVE